MKNFIIIQLFRLWLPSIAIKQYIRYRFADGNHVSVIKFLKVLIKSLSYDNLSDICKTVQENNK